MISGIIAGGLVSIFWIGAHIGWMHIQSSENRFKSMLTGYLISLPLVALLCLWAIHWTWLKDGSSGQAVLGLSFLHAYLWHLLLFFGYVEFFYMVERAVTLRFLMEILRRPAAKAQLDQIMADYNIENMIRNRLAALDANHFIERVEGQWRLKPKGMRLARAMRTSAWIYQSVGQPDRL